MSKTKVLIVEDNPAIRAELEKYLEHENFETRCVGDGISAVEGERTFAPDLVVLDIMLSGPESGFEQPMDGIEVLRRIRLRSVVPVIMLTETAINYVKVAALSMGADDYITKPFDPAELVARIRAILRRSAGIDASAPPMVFQRVRIDTAARRVWKDDKLLELSPIEYDILCALARRPGQVFSRDQLLARAWRHEHFGGERVVDVHVRRLRKKVEDDPRQPQLILTVRGAGYCFEDQPA